MCHDATHQHVLPGPLHAPVACFRDIPALGARSCEGGEHAWVVLVQAVQQLQCLAPQSLQCSALNLRKIEDPAAAYNLNN